MLNTMERRIVTVEDPVEHKLPGVMQIAIKPEINLTFAAALRSILRGDPNVIMVGEMRDFETAEIAIRAALTGHLVFSTLHTNDAIGGITRLIDMGVQPFLVSSSVRAFLAQRLVRVLCPALQAARASSTAFLEQVGFPMAHADRVMQAVGCERMPPHRLPGPRRALRNLPGHARDAGNDHRRANRPRRFAPAALQEGMVPLRQDGWNRVIAGTTTIEEVVRVTAADVDVLDE